MEAAWLAVPGVIIWAGILILPWQPWRTREKLETNDGKTSDLSGVTVLVPARNEAAVIAETLLSLVAQGENLNIILVDDQSTDETVIEATRLNIGNLTIINGRPLEPGWTGKLWALHQGLSQVKTENILLLDADIQLKPGVISSLQTRMRESDLDLVSLMASLRMQAFWEKLLLPAFVYFFKLLYPFHLSNSKSNVVAAAAGGCILVRRNSLAQAGGFEGIKDKLIDDCALARKFKDAGLATWIGLSRAAVSRRRYDSLADIWNMVARTAFTQLRYSGGLLALCSFLLISAYLLPIAGLLIDDVNTRRLALLGIFLMITSYLPTLRYYEINPLWALALPLAGTLYLLMTWSSAQRYWGGVAANWKNRRYAGEGGRLSATPLERVPQKR